MISLEESHLVKPESKDVIWFIKNIMKLKVAMITGDNKHSAYKVARHVGIDLKDVYYSSYP